jgi:hypothetical protein
VGAFGILLSKCGKIYNAKIGSRLFVVESGRKMTITVKIEVNVMKDRIVVAFITTYAINAYHH